MWVDDLRHLVYQADDLLDEIVYEHLRQKVHTRKMKKVCDFFSPSSNAFIFRRNMAKKMMTLVELLEKHYNEAAPLGLVVNENARPEIDVISQYRETISELEDHKIVGRDVEVESIVKQVIDASNNQLTSILPIVGMGGLGKTTLAKLVFKHELVRQHFDKTVWVCVSEPFIVNKILLDILQNLKGGISNGGDSKEVFLLELQKEMLGQTYFLVLDDVWNENSFLWDELKYCLLKITGNSKNSIVVTTRSAEVAKIMGTCSCHLLSKLSNDQYANETKTKYKMHDLVHDIAMAVSKDQNWQLNHRNILEELKKKEIQNIACKLRTIDFIQKIPHNIDQTLFDVEIRSFVCLRVLKISINKLPKSIGQLKHLRYLEISRCRDALKIPEPIVSLHNLQTLKFHYFSVILEIPTNFTNLVNLRHFKVGTICSKMPPHLSQLTQLQTLSHFAVGFEKGCKITELGPLKNLQERYLGGCNSCEKLPMLGQLNNLKKLEIYRFQVLQIIDNEFYGNDPNQRRFFPKLEKFVMQNMINLEQWEEVMTNDASSNVTIFPNLRSLKTSRCPKLLNIPEVFDESDMQHFESLFVSHCNKLTQLPNELQFCSSIRRVTIDHCSNLSINMRNKLELWYLHIGPLNKLPEDLCHLMNLRVVKIVGNMEDYDFGILQHLPSLKQICLVEDVLSNNSVTQIPQQLQHLTALESLGIENFGGIEALPEWLGNIVCLQTLDLRNCKKLKKIGFDRSNATSHQIKQLVCLHMSDATT
uniref:Uncharacterized protein n=1 Tax=Cucumis melo TaxID=3656 RepID=A0A1S4E3X3_CUCME